MANPPPLVERLKKGLLRIEQQPSGGPDDEAMEPLHRSLERTLSRLTPGNTVPASPFRFQVTGGKALLFLNTEALPLEPAKLVQILNSVQVELQPGETLELDGGLAAWLIRPEANLTESNLRQADTSVRTMSMKTGRDRDYVAVQAAETTKVRLRSRLTQLVAAMQVAQKDLAGEPTDAPAPMAAPVVPTVAAPTPPPAVRIDGPPPPELLAKALRKALAAIEGSGFKAALIGDLAHQAWGSSKAAQKIEILVSSKEPERETVLGALRGEGLQQVPAASPLSLRYTDAKLSGTAPLELIEATTPFHEQILTRAKSRPVINVDARVAGCEDLIILRAGSSRPPDRNAVIDLLRVAAAHLDAPYLKREAEAAGIFDKLKSLWQQAKQPD